MYLVSVGVECVCVKGSLVLVLVLDLTQCLPQGVGAPPAMLRGRTAGFHKNWVAGPPERRDRWIQFAQPHPPPPTVAHQTQEGYWSVTLSNRRVLPRLQYGDNLGLSP